MLASQLPRCLLSHTSGTLVCSSWSRCWQPAADKAHLLLHTAGLSSDQGAGHEDTHSQQQRSSNPEQVTKNILRGSHVAEAAMTSFFEGQRLVLRSRPDTLYYKEQEAEQLQAVQQLMPKYHVRPSALLRTARTAALAAGALAAVAPKSVSLAVTGAVQDALTEHYTDSLRALRESGQELQQTEEVRQAVRQLRDTERAPEGAPGAPDLLTLQRMERIEDLGLQGLVGAVTKAVVKAGLTVTSKL